MPTLPPTVHERLAECGTRVFVDGMVPGAEVELEVGGDTITHSAVGNRRTFTVPAMTGGDGVRARQNAGSGVSEWSPSTTVESVDLPLEAAPRLPSSIGNCSHCLRVDGLVPGCEVELLVGPEVIGSGTATRHGDVCLGVELKRIHDDSGDLRAQMSVCGQQSPEGTAPLVQEPFDLPAPNVGEPLFGCQTVVPLHDVHKGARVRLRTSDGQDLGSFCSCWEDVNVHIGVPLATGDTVQAQAYWEGDVRCREESSWSAGQEVVPPDERIRPTVREPLIEGDQHLRIEDQIEGGELMVKIRPSATEPAVEYGPRPVGSEEEIALAEPLVAGNVVSVVQTLCGVSMESEAVTVMGPPPEVHAPVVIPPLNDCGRAVQVSNLYPGAVVRLFQDGHPIGQVWAGMNTSISVTTAPSLVAGKTVTAKQWVGGVESPESDGVDVHQVAELIRPDILSPVARGDQRVWVSGVALGARVTVESGGEVIGEANAAEPVMRVPVSPVDDIVLATVSLCGVEATSERVVPIKDPCASGGFTHVGDAFRSYGTFHVPATTDSDPFDHPIEGQLYFPGGGDGPDPDAGLLPLIVIAHGQWDTGDFTDGTMFYHDEDTGERLPVDSYLGYDYLARHLAGWGAIVFSLDLDTVSRQTTLGTSSGRTHLYARAEIILEALKRALEDPDLTDHVNDERLGLIGHSMGGEGVVVAQHLNRTEARGFDIRGVVSIAPTNWRNAIAAEDGRPPEVPLEGTNYLQLFGSMDLLMASLSAVTGTSAQWSGFRHYDLAWRPKTHAWIHGARHNPFNRRWVGTTDFGEGNLVGDERVLSNEEHERIARCLINTFFRDALGDQPAYVGYLEGTVLPQRLTDLPVFIQHSSDENRDVVDNFGDEDEQVPLPGAGLDKTENSLGQPNTATGAGIAVWEDVQHAALEHSPHDTRGVELAWDAPAAEYTSETGGVAHGDEQFVGLRVAQFFPDHDRNVPELALDGFVQLGDGSQESTVRLGAVGTVPYPHDARQRLSVLRTVRLPLTAFRAANDALDLADIQQVGLRLNGQFTGHLLADDVEFSD